MYIINVWLDGWNNIYVKLNWVAVIILVIAILIVSFLIKICAYIAKKHSITIDEVNLGIGDTSVKLVYNKKDQEIAYK